MPGSVTFLSPCAFSCPANKPNKPNKTHPTHSHTKPATLSLYLSPSLSLTHTHLCNAVTEERPVVLFTHPTHHHQHTDCKVKRSAVWQPRQVQRSSKPVHIMHIMHIMHIIQREKRLCRLELPSVHKRETDDTHRAKTKEPIQNYCCAFPCRNLSHLSLQEKELCVTRVMSRPCI